MNRGHDVERPTRDVRLDGRIVDVDPTTGHAIGIRRLVIEQTDAQRLAAQVDPHAEAKHHPAREAPIQAPLAGHRSLEKTIFSLSGDHIMLRLTSPFLADSKSVGALGTSPEIE